MPEYGLTFFVALAVAFVITPGVIWLASDGGLGYARGAEGT